MNYIDRKSNKFGRNPALYVMTDGDSHLGSNPTIRDAFVTLEHWGFQVDVEIAEEIVTQPESLNVTHDLYVLKSNTELTLSIAGLLHSQGAKMVNPYLSCASVQDKIVTSRLLGKAGRHPV